jgi:hypothetical protein
MYPTIPDVNVFINDLNQRSDTRQIYSTFLSNHLGYFQEIRGEKAIVINGLIADLDFVREFMNYLKEATTQTQVVDGVIVTPANTEEETVKKIEALNDSHNQFSLTLEKLGETMKLLNAKTRVFLTALNDEVVAIDEKYSEKIQKATLEFEKVKSKINKAYSEKVTEVTEKFEQKNVALNKEVIHLEKVIQDINNDIEQLEGEIKNATINKDEQAEAKLKGKRSELKKQGPEFVAAMKNMKIKIHELEDSKKNQLFQLRQENQAEIKEASRDLLEIEEARDAEKKFCQDEMEKMEDYTSKITSDLDKLGKTMEATLNAFDYFGIRGGNVPPLLVHMPFHLVYYMSQSERRFIYVAPSIVNTICVGVRLKSLGRKKLTQLFQPRSQKTLTILNRFIVLLNENVAFRHEITEACSKASLLKSNEDRALIQNGLNELKEEGWISNDEFESFSQTLTQI